jgi:hypothetical protein
MKFNKKAVLLAALFLLYQVNYISGKDFHVTGRVTDVSGNIVSGATVSMFSGTREYRAVTGANGYYSLNLSGVYGGIAGLIEGGMPYPNPFAYTVHIPFILSSHGDVRFSVYSMTGKKITEYSFQGVQAGSYSINWDGCNNSRSPVPQGFYIYAISFRGETVSGRLIKTSGAFTTSSGTSLEQVSQAFLPAADPGAISVKVITSVTCSNYYPLRLTDIAVRRDTTIDFELAGMNAIPFMTKDDHIAMYSPSGYRKMILKGINLGSSPPGTFPGEIAYAISDEYYEKWIKRIADAGFNCIRVYTLHPPVFYEKLANYNSRNRDNPVFLFQGVWLGETENRRDPLEYDLMRRSADFINDIQEVTDCVHGNKTIPFRYGRAYGKYQTDVSEWIAAYIIGREIAPQEVDTTNRRNPSVTSYTGVQFSIGEASASNVFTARMLDEVVKYEMNNYSIHRPVSMSSWPTLDPLLHPTEVFTDEDKASIDITLISRKQGMAGIFATYHAYPYYPNFISEQPSYQAYSDSEGPDSYAGYLEDLKNHYSDIPLIIGEFGVPSSWGNAHWSYSNMDHGGYSETQQGEKNMRLMHNILDAGCAGGFMFAWMDEWFKPTWIVQYLEAYGFDPGTGVIPTRQLWHNITSPEQNFGLLYFEQSSVLPFTDYQGISGPAVGKMSATHDNSFFYLNIDLQRDIQLGDTVMVAFDTYLASTGESVLPNGRLLLNRSEFVLEFIAGQDSASHYVTQAYDMNGLTPNFDLTDPAVQKYRSTVSDGKPWKLMKWINDGFLGIAGNIGSVPVENSAGFSTGKRSVVAWTGRKIKVRIPWTMLHFYDPTQMLVIDGAVSYDGGWSFSITPKKSDGISVSVYADRSVVSSTSRYNWDTWLIVPNTFAREKKSLHLVGTGLSLIPDFIN